MAKTVKHKRGYYDEWCFVPALQEKISFLGLRESGLFEIRTDDAIVAIPLPVLDEHVTTIDRLEVARKALHSLGSMGKSCTKYFAVNQRTSEGDRGVVYQVRRSVLAVASIVIYGQLQTHAAALLAADAFSYEQLTPTEKIAHLKKSISLFRSSDEISA